MKIAILFALFFAVASADFFICDVNNLLPPADFDQSFICVNDTSSISVTGPVIATIPAADGRNVFSPPTNESSILTFLSTDLFGTYINGSETSFKFQIDGGSSVGSSSSCEISYDFDGDGSWDRIELYDIFSTDPVDLVFENWTSSLNTTQNVTGSFSNFLGGSIRVRVWSAFGEAPMALKIGVANSTSDLVSEISFPFTFAQACCGKIDLITDELNDLKARVDILSSKLLNVTQNCCSSTGTSGTTIATATGLSTATVSGTSTAVGTATSA
jgi:hypothetical protein